MKRIPLFLAVAILIPIGALGWLGGWVIQQERAVERQHQRDALEVQAGQLALNLDKHLQNIEIELTQHGGVPLRESAVEDAPEDALSEAEDAEFKAGDYQAAAAKYRRLAASPRPTVRAAALVGLGRLLMHVGDFAGALRTYTQLSELHSVRFAVWPADLVGRQGECRVLEQLGDRQQLLAKAMALAEALDKGQWPITNEDFDNYHEMLERWGAPPVSQEAEARFHATEELRQAVRGGELTATGRRIVQTDLGPVLAVWAEGPQGPAAWLGTPDELQTQLHSSWDPSLAVSLSSIEGKPFLGEAHDGSVIQTRPPFLVHVASQAPSVGDGRTLLMGGLALAVAAILAAGYGLHRTTQRELTLARQQSDFVSAVSHEFRTPLTSMRHLTDLLLTRRVKEERRTEYYELLAHETERLHRMVDGLLSFGRMEAGAYVWKLERVDVAEFVDALVDEFRRQSQVRDRKVTTESESGLPAIRADREALSRALWNLLENAARYSSDESPIRVAARLRGNSVLLAVGDEGVGIPAAEQEKVFQKFVRGGHARNAGVRGVGIGLALVKEIAEAHGGSVLLESRPGEGSTFTLVIPCLES